MVMKPDVWAQALDDVIEQAQVPSSVLIVPTPAGSVFTQHQAKQLSQAEHLVFACGRYEGIDARVIDYFNDRQGVHVMEVSIGDYVLNGGEVAALVMTEAIGRLIPGVVGNPDSLTEESHEEGLLEYPSYTRPASWRGYDAPPVLLSGHHAHIARWRRDQSLLRTAERRPDLLTDAVRQEIAERGLESSADSSQ